MVNPLLTLQLRCHSSTTPQWPKFEVKLVRLTKGMEPAYVFLEGVDS
jgi:hypothetical protein